MTTIELKKMHPHGITLRVCGSIQKVLAGNPDEKWKSAVFQANDYKLGFGAASPESFESLGEGIIINGHCFATVTNPTTPDYMKTVGAHRYYSMLMSAIPKEAEPSFICTGQPVESDLYTVLSSLYEQTKQSVAWGGLMKCSQINSMILKKSPIYGDSIFDHKSEYVEKKLFDTPSWVYMMGLYTSDDAPNKPLVDELKERAFYVNPLDEQQEILTHTHGLLLKKEVSNLQAINLEVPSHAIHVLNMDTIVTEIKFLELYNIDNIEPLNPM
jgi:hypothetical protein